VKIWKFRILWISLAINAVFFVFISSFSITPIAGGQGEQRAQQAQTTSPDNYVTRVFTDAQGRKMTYYLYIPANYNAHVEYPLVLLLQGGGERARVNNTAEQNRNLLLDQAYVRVWGPGYPGQYTPNVQAQWPAFIVVPQVIYPQQWVNVPANTGPYTLAAQPTNNLLMAKEIVDALEKQYTNIDPHRLYITGLSMGGYGVWDAIERWPNYFAAAAPLAGAGDPSKANRLVNLPIWAFHGSADGTVPVAGSRDMIQAIKAAGGHPLYTEYAGAGHVIWDKVYSTMNAPSPTPTFFSWLFSQRIS